MGLCDGSDRADPHARRTCAVAAMNSTEASQRAVLSIGSLPELRNSETVKRVGPPTHKERGRIPWWKPNEMERESREEQRRTRTIRKTPGPVSDNLGRSRSPESCGFNSVDRITGPGEHTNEPAKLQEKRGQASGNVRMAIGKREEVEEGARKVADVTEVEGIPNDIAAWFRGWGSWLIEVLVVGTVGLITLCVLLRVCPSCLSMLIKKMCHKDTEHHRKRRHEDEARNDDAIEMTPVHQDN
ncbi:hypothetical protein NDU88_009989 [Pleurodeles waltl]|uniref:Uncharacterized protein n=1 Tax=Pleurodeles waltl TaxID=8319 RepID=A0AAV7QT47_PLEWA|nr:hypothetical protein NDU88_009989 [Pleurodeles waltl]